MMIRTANDSTAGNWPMVVLTAIVLGTLGVQGWAADNFWTRGAGNFNWNVAQNWSQNGVPTADPFEEEGIIENGDTVFLASAAPNAAGIRLGRTAGTSGGLQIQSGGSINVVDSTGAPNGTVSVGVDGQGTLVIQPGGSLMAQFLGVNAQSSLTAGGTGGAATLAVTNAATLNGTTRIAGAGHNVSAGSVTLGGASTLFAELRASSHSPIRASGVAALGGEFVLEFGGGFTPTIGTSWDIIDASGISGQFAAVDLSAAPALGPGQVFRLATRSGGVNGQLLQLQYRNVLTLNVDWDSKEVSISSPSGETIAIDGYSILSGSGGLSVGQWNSLQDQALSGWAESTPSSTALNELNSNVGGSLGIGGTPRELGTPFNPVIGPFGQSPEDLRFEYTIPATDEVIEGLVNYTGNRIVNNLLLTVDPVSGQAQLKNSSPNPLSIDGYSIISTSGSLLPGNGDWLSLADQGITGWQESNSNTGALNELLTAPGGSLTLNSGQALSLGGLFNELTGERDLVLEFSRLGDSDARVGTVIYGSLATMVDGDYNSNGVVDSADYVVWRKNVGQSTLPNRGTGITGPVGQADYNFWKSHFGATSGSGSIVQSAIVPEPTTSIAACIAGVLACGWRRGADRRRKHGCFSARSQAM